MRELFANIGRVTDLLPILLFIFFAIKGRKQINKGYWVIFFYCCWVALNDIVFFNYVSEKYDKLLFSSFTLIEYAAFTFLLWYNTENKKFQSILILLLVAFGLFIIPYYIFAPFKLIDSIPIGVETILVIGLSVYALYEQVNNSVELITTKPIFWIITGYLIYLAGCLFIYLYANTVPYEELYKFFFITYAFTSIKSIFITVAFWMAYKELHNNNNTPRSREYQPFLN